jgi:hypothetical protein
VSEAVIFFMAEVVTMGALMAVREAGALGSVALDWISLAAPTWSECLRILSGAFPFLAGISTPLNGPISSFFGRVHAGGPG